MTLLIPNGSRRYTPQDLLSMPNNNSMELINGQIVDKTGSLLSSEVEGLIFFRIATYLRHNPVAEVYLQSLGYTCFPDDPQRMRKADVSVVSRSQLDQLPDHDLNYMPIAPDLAIKVLSPFDVVYAVDDRIDEYQKACFPLIWIADSKARTITVYPLNGRPAIFVLDDEITAENALPGFRCKVCDFFPSMRAATE